jgi:pimeloyl-ACP methyl ester carboxylesterase
MKIKANGISMNYEIKGKGENLVLIHGACDNLNMWYHQLPVFSKKCRVISYDLRGSGETEIPEGDYSISVFAQDVYELMKEIKVENACFLGYSIGGCIALELAINHPEMVNALVLANSPIGLPPLSPSTRERRQKMVEILDKGDARGFVNMMASHAFSPDFKSKNPAEFEKYLNIKLQNKPEGLAQVFHSLSVPSTPPDLGKVKCPVLLIVGGNDLDVVTGQGRKIHEAIPGSRLITLPAGHTAAIESPKEFNAAVLEFLSGARAG